MVINAFYNFWRNVLCDKNKHFLVMANNPSGGGNSEPLGRCLCPSLIITLNLGRAQGRARLRLLHWHARRHTGTHGGQAAEFVL